MTIIREHSAGTPWGCYDVTYYTIRGGHVKRDASGDSNVSEGYVRRAAARLTRHEALRAICRSQPGGLDAAGSPEALAVLDNI